MIQHNWHELRLMMWDYVGMSAHSKRLAIAKRRIDLLKQEVQEVLCNFRVSTTCWSCRNLLRVAELIVSCALERKGVPRTAL